MAQENSEERPWRRAQGATLRFFGVSDEGPSQQTILPSFDQPEPEPTENIFTTLRRKATLNFRNSSTTSYPDFDPDIPSAPPLPRSHSSGRDVNVDDLEEHQFYDDDDLPLPSYNEIQHHSIDSNGSQRHLVSNTPNGSTYEMDPIQRLRANPNGPKRHTPKPKDPEQQAFEETILQDPEVRAQLEKLKVYKPWFLGFCTIVQVALLIYELVYNSIHYGEWIQLEPINVMIGPGAYTLIQTGAKFNPCINGAPFLKDQDQCPPNLTTGGLFAIGNDTVLCGDLQTFCGLADFGTPGVPDQWYRFITAIFLHAGVVHLIFNMLVQVRTGFGIERSLGPIRVFVIYMSSGIFGFGLSALFNPLTPTVGASGAIYGLVAILLVDVIQNWKLLKNPKKELAFLLIIILISLAIGVLPYLDNWAHIGGFVMGLVTGIILVPSIHFGKRDVQRRRILLVVGVILYFVLFIGVFYLYYSGADASSCVVCGYFDCVPFTPGWCDQ